MVDPISPVLPFAVAFGLSLGLTYVVRAWAAAVGLVDLPDGGLHAHDRPVPRVGGMAVYASLAAVVLLYLGWSHQELSSTAELEPLLVLVTGGAGIFAIGFWDDTRGMTAWAKLMLETCLAVLVFWAGIRIGGLTIPGDGSFELPLWLSLPVTVLWLVGITNAFNLIDGSDGVAAGAALFASATTALISIINGHEVAAVVSMAIAGATLGFLFFNFPPASIFLGDCGSLVLGFMLAGLGAVSMQKAPTALAVIIPVLAFGVPILDTLLVVVRRFLRREPIFNGDRGHIHHRLRELGMSSRGVAMLLYGLCAGFAGLSLLLMEPRDSGALLVLVVVGAVVWVLVQRLRIPELVELQRLVRRGLAQREVIAHNMRIRQAVGQLQAARDVPSVLSALAFAFEAGEFERVDLWMSHALAPSMAGCHGVERRGSGYLWTFHANRFVTAGELWQIQLPFRDANGVPTRAIGHVGLWGRTGNIQLLTDLRLIGLTLLPEVQIAMARIRESKHMVKAL